ncbi:MAG: tRNA lysidine(34) synthetase TilS [Kiritimatiellae bacterium]|nr:tRNA lysidine(34) synthetase TilS [Kiritimatiellia bacterium]
MTTRRSSFVTGLAATLKQNGLLSEHKHLLLAVSGGADSVALLLAMHALKRSFGFRITVAHLDHQLRGSEGRADAAFVASLAKRLRVACVTGRSDVRGVARRKHISLEMAAREVRYRFLARTARAKGTTAIVTAHTADDQAETVLLRLARGSGATGLGGIRPEGRVSELGLGIPPSDIVLLRPLLDVSRADIEAFLNRADQPWREDVSNASTAFLRNRVRHELLPLLEARLNPSVRQTLCRTAEILAEEEEWLNDMAARALDDCLDDGDRLERKALGLLPPALARRVVRRWLMTAGVPPDAVDFGAVERVRALAAQDAGSREVALQGPQCVVRRYGQLSVETAAPMHAPFRVGLTVPGETLLPEQGLRVVVCREPGVVREAGDEPGRLPASASLSCRAVGRRRLYLRSAQPGDRLQPYGMKGSRKLQDIFVDAKVPADQRGSIPILECGGAIAWIPGYRIAHPFRVTDEKAPNLKVRIERL